MSGNDKETIGIITERGLAKRMLYEGLDKVKTKANHFGEFLRKNPVFVRF